MQTPSTSPTRAADRLKIRDHTDTSISPKVHGLHQESLLVLYSPSMEQCIMTCTHHYTLRILNVGWEAVVLGSGVGVRRPRGPLWASHTITTWTGLVLWGSGAELTQAAAGWGGSQQLASSRQEKKQCLRAARVRQEPLSMRPAFHTVESKAHFYLKRSMWVFS